MLAQDDRRGSFFESGFVGGNSLVDRLHSKVQHREKVMNKILVYLGE